MTQTPETAPDQPAITAEYRGTCRLYEILDGGERIVFAAPDAGIALAQHFGGHEDDRMFCPGDEVTVRKLDPATEHAVALLDEEPSTATLPEAGRMERRGADQIPTIIAPVWAWAQYADRVLATWRVRVAAGVWPSADRAVLISTTLF